MTPRSILPVLVLAGVSMISGCAVPSGQTDYSWQGVHFSIVERASRFPGERNTWAVYWGDTGRDCENLQDCQRVAREMAAEIVAREMQPRAAERGDDGGGGHAD